MVTEHRRVLRKYRRTASTHEVDIAHDDRGNFVSPDGEPKDGNTVGARVSQEMLVKIEADMQRRGISKAKWIRLAFQLLLTRPDYS